MPLTIKTGTLFWYDKLAYFKNTCVFSSCEIEIAANIDSSKNMMKNPGDKGLTT